LNTASTENNRARFRRVLAYIDAHLDDGLGVERLSGVAAFSKYHFHRRFAALLGIGVYQYVQLRRLKRASYLLAFRAERSIIDIALASGYEGPASFSLAFSRRVGQSPSDFRRQPRWDPWYTTFQTLSDSRVKLMMSPDFGGQVKIIQFGATKVAAFEHRGDPRLIGDSLRRFIEWRRLHRLPPASSATFNIAYDDPDKGAPEDYRFDICAATDGEVAANPFGVVGKTIPGGRCAVLRHIGSDETLGAAARYLHAEWLPLSGEQPSGLAMFFQRVRFFPDVPEHEAVTDVFLPLSGHDSQPSGAGTLHRPLP